MEITIAHKPGVGWWYRVHKQGAYMSSSAPGAIVSPTHDWSGIASTMDEAWHRARVLAVRVDDTGVTNVAQAKTEGP